MSNTLNQEMYTQKKPPLSINKNNFQEESKDDEKEEMKTIPDTDTISEPSIPNGLKIIEPSIEMDPKIIEPSIESGLKILYITSFYIVCYHNLTTDILI